MANDLVHALTSDMTAPTLRTAAGGGVPPMQAIWYHAWHALRHTETRQLAAPMAAKIRNQSCKAHDDHDNLSRIMASDFDASHHHHGMRGVPARQHSMLRAARKQTSGPLSRDLYAMASWRPVSY